MGRLIFCMVSTFVTRQSDRRKQTYMCCTMGYYMWNDWMRLSTHKSGMLDVCSEFSTSSSFYLSERQEGDQVSFPSTFPLWPPGPHCWSSQHARLTSNSHALCCPPDGGTAPDSSPLLSLPQSHVICSMRPRVPHPSRTAEPAYPRLYPLPPLWIHHLLTNYAIHLFTVLIFCTPIAAARIDRPWGQGPCLFSSPW